jgi:glycosyltransferase involved in cell wall biosynthesis
MNKKIIVFVNQSSGYLMIDIIHAFGKHFTDNVLIAGTINPRNNPLRDQVVIEKIVPISRKSALKRLISWSLGFLKTLYLVKTKYRNAHLFLTTNPPFAPLIPLFCTNSYTLLIYDVYPDVLTEFKILRKDSIFVKLWQKANCKVYAKADQLFTISEGMKSCMGQYSGDRTVQVVPVWTDNQFLKPVAKNENPFVINQGLVDKFIVLYSGNLGYTHDLDVIIEIAAQIKHQDLFFLIIGEGEKKSQLQQKISDYGLTNCRILPWQPVETLPYSLSAADLGIVSLGKGASMLSVPSKTFNLMSVGVPLLCIASKESELSRLVRKHEIGKCFASDEVTAMIEFIESLADNPSYHKTLRENALKASNQYGTENAKRFTMN